MTDSRVAQALEDLRRGLVAFDVWNRLGWHDIKQRYRRSMLGPLWLTLSAAVFIGAIGFLYSKFFNQPTAQFVPFLAVGYIVWTLLSTTVIESCVVFVQSENIMKQIKLPLTAHVCRMLWRNMLIFLHNFVIVPVVILIAGKPLTWHALSLPVALVVVLWNCLWVSLLLGMACARFRDIPPLVTNLVSLVFFLSPIMWMPGILGSRIWVAYVNPVHHLIEIFRAPLLEGRIPLISYAVCALIGVAGSLFCIAMLARYRHRVAYWL